MIHIRPPYTAPIVARVRSSTRVGADPDLWVSVSTDASRADPESKSDLKVGDVVRFTAQYGIRAKDDDSNLVVLRGKIVAPRTPALPDSYGVQATEIVKTWKLDPTVSTPISGQVFLVAPWSIAAVEPSTVMTPAGTMEPFSSTESSTTEPVTTREVMGTAPQATGDGAAPSSGSNVGLLIAAVAVVVLLGVGALWTAG